ncbi:tRNA (guanine(37)-N1)-methyltransferase [Frankliniella fusca]|uniref:tRNA (guanine(37)-N1)-methyltransferase n=1 Tax=Frankliniella fusca TaxID=407009 RepID=A0AAE1LBG4_9NEOP|nr:tRNA (guanine(37)-N1)-methyltransferase [Frankliniella fusca]
MSSEQQNGVPDNLLMPPSTVHGMKILHKSQFSKTVSVPHIICSIDNLPETLKAVKKYLLKVPNLTPVENVEGMTQKRILLDPIKIKCLETSEREKLENVGIKEENIQMCDINLTYENWTAESILKAVLPAGQEGVASWSVVGHIIHVNLREHLHDFKHLIGEVLLDKNKALTVVNKVNSIDSKFRTFQIELLAGKDDWLTQVRENHCTYHFDFSKVYWNPRLCGEHERLVKDLQSGDVLYDVFAGVGPFSIPAAKKHCRVLANDLNPESFHWLKHNVKVNKVIDYVTVFNKDGGDFILEDIKSDMQARWKASDFNNIHITMNLPAMAVEFIKNFKCLYSLEEKPSSFVSPIVHVYCFIKNAKDSSKAAKELVEQELGTELGENLKRVFLVRTVSNNKDMMRVTFTIPEGILFGARKDDGEPAAKKVLSTMGKNKGNKGKATSNVFKVAGARSLKIKNKAKQVAGQLKKLNEKTKQKTVEVDGQLASLHQTLMQQKPSAVTDNGAVKAALQKMTNDRVQQAEDLKKNVQDIDKFSNIKL